MHRKGGEGGGSLGSRPGNRGWWGHRVWRGDLGALGVRGAGQGGITKATLPHLHTSLFSLLSQTNTTAIMQSKHSLTRGKRERERE